MDCSDCKEKSPSKAAQDDAAAKKLWAVSEKWTQLSDTWAILRLELASQNTLLAMVLFCNITRNVFSFKIAKG